MSEKSALGTMGEEFIEARFDPKYRELFQGKIAEFEQQKSGQKNPIPIYFHGDLDTKAAKAIKLLVNQILAFADYFGLILQNTKPEIHFFSVPAWEKTVRKKMAPDIPLPASKIASHGHIAKVQIILPPQISSNEAVINIVR